MSEGRYTTIVPEPCLNGDCDMDITKQATVFRFILEDVCPAHNSGEFQFLLESPFAELRRYTLCKYIILDRE
jgi:hypothetical protein